MYGRPSFFYKPVEPNRTFGVTSQLALERLRTLLKSKNHAFIYHCYNHYFCPVGFEREPPSQEHIYFYNNKPISNNNQQADSTTTTTNTSIASTTSDPDQFIEWILIAETSRKYPAFHCFKWDDIERDLSSRSPDYVNIRKLERGVQKRRQVANDASSQSTEPVTPASSAASAVPTGNNHFVNDPTEKSSTTERRPRVRRTGENLHCLMMFQSFDSSSWQVSNNNNSSDLINSNAADDMNDDEDDDSSSTSSSY